MLIQKPITASKIQEALSYYLSSSSDTFNLEDYRGIPVQYPNGFIGPDGNYVLVDGNKVYNRTIPTTGPISFSDFLGATGYFASYPNPEISITQDLGTQTVTSNVGDTTHVFKVAVDRNNDQVVDWRPKVTRVDLIVQWQIWTGTAYSNLESARTYSDVGSTRTISRTDDNQGPGTIKRRAQVTVISYAANDDNIPLGGSLGDLREVGRATITTGQGTTKLDAYVPPPPGITFNLHTWNDQTAAGIGDYIVERRVVDDVLLASPNVALSFAGGKVGTATFASAPGRSPVTETQQIEWYFINQQDANQTDWLPVSALDFSDGNTYGFTASDSGISITGLDDIRFDDFQFKATITATQQLSSPSETVVISKDSPVYRMEVSPLDRVPVYEITGSRSTVYGGVMEITFDANHVGTRDYSWSIDEVNAGDFDETSGTFTITNNGQATFTVSSVLDGQTVTTTNPLTVYDVETGLAVATTTLSLIYGEPAYRIVTGNLTRDEDQEFDVQIEVDNLGDTTVYIKYGRTQADDTGVNDFIIDGTPVDAGDYYPVNVVVDPDKSDSQRITSVGSVRISAINDSPFGGDADNSETFNITLHASQTNAAKDVIYVTINDALNFQIDVFGGPSIGRLTYESTNTVANTTYVPGSASIDYTLDKKFHVSWANYEPKSIRYMWHVRESGDPGVYTPILATWRDVTDTTKYTLWSDGDTEITANLDQLTVTGYYGQEMTGIAGSGTKVLSDLRFTVFIQAKATVSDTSVSAHCEESKFFVTEDASYIRYGIYWVKGVDITEGTLDSAEAQIKTKGVIGSTVTMTLSDPNNTHRLVDFPDVSPPQAKQTPILTRTFKIDNELNTCNFGAWFDEVYGYYGGGSVLNVNATLAGTRFDDGYGERNGKLTVNDQGAQTGVTSPQTPGAVLNIKAGESFDIELFGKNISNGYIGYTIPGGDDWFNSTIGSAQATFDTPITGSYYDRANAKYQGFYRTDSITIQSQAKDYYFEPKEFTINPTPQSAGTIGGLRVIVSATVPKEPIYSINLTKRGITPFMPGATLGVNVTIDGQEPAELTHTWEISYLAFGPEPARFATETDTIRLGYPSASSDDVIWISPLDAAAGTSFDLVVKDSNGNQKGRASFDVANPPPDVSVTDIVANVYAPNGLNFISVTLPPEVGGGTFQLPDLSGINPTVTAFPFGTSVATATGGSGVYTSYDWSYTLTEGSVLGSAADGNQFTISSPNEKVTGIVKCIVTDSAGNKTTGIGNIRFNHDRPAIPFPSLTATLNDTIDARTIIEYNGGDDGYATDSVTVNVAGGSGNYSYEWSFEPRNVTRVTLTGSGETSATVTGVITGATGLNYLPPGTVGSASGTVTCKVTDTQIGAMVTVSCGVYLSITVKDQQAGGGGGRDFYDGTIDQLK